MSTGSMDQAAAQAPGFRLPRSVLVWLGLVGYLLLVKLVLSLLPALNVSIVAGDFSWPNIVVLGALGLVGAWLADRTGFMPALDARVSNRQRFVVPLLVGAGLAVLAVIIDILTHGTQFIEAQTGEASFNVNFPASLLVYSGGVVLVEAFLVIFPYPVLQGLISNLILRNRWPERVFWVLAAVLALLEPVTQGLGIVFMKSTTNPANVLLTQFLPYFITAYPSDLIQAIFFRKRGFLAAIAVRLGFYLIWHILYGNFIYPRLGG